MSDYFTIKEFSSYTLESFMRDFCRAYHRDNGGAEKKINILIDTLGGEINIAFGMIDFMAKFPDATISMATISKAYSCGAFLLAHGTKGHRFASTNASIMAHETVITSQQRSDKCTFYTGTSDFCKTNNVHFCELFSLAIGKQKNFLRKKLNSLGNADWYMSAEEAKENNVIDFVDIPDWLLQY